MKKGWQTKKLGDVCAFDKTQGIHRGLPYVGLEHIESHTARFIGSSEVQPVKSSTFRFSDEHVLYGRLRPYLNKALAPDFEGHCSTEIFPLKPSPELSREYLLFWLLADATCDRINATCTGARMPRAQMNDVLGFEIPVPPLAEQQRIVGLLDEAFEGLATAKANAEKNLQNARALFESHLQSVFTQRGPTGQEQAKSQTRSTDRSPAAADDAEMARLHAGYVTRTGGREATTRHIPGPLSLAVGMPSTGACKGWRWSALTDLARLESGHTPSRSHSEYWGGAIPWIGIQDARKHHGERIDDTAQTINELGTANSSARLLPANTVCLSRTASVGYVVVMGRPMATSQDFVNWVCSASLVPDFLKYILLAESRDGLLRYASGSVHQTIYFPEAKAFHICHPDTKEQLRIVKQCEAMREETQRLARLYERKHAALEALKKSLLHQAFTGEL